MRSFRFTSEIGTRRPEEVVACLFRYPLLEVRRERNRYNLLFARRIRHTSIQAALGSRVNAAPKNFAGEVLWRSRAPIGRQCCWLKITKDYDTQQPLFNKLEDVACRTAAHCGPIIVAFDTTSKKNPFGKRYAAYRCVQHLKHDCADDRFAAEMSDCNEHAYELLRCNDNDEVSPFRPYMDIEWETDGTQSNGLTNPADVMSRIMTTLDEFYCSCVEKITSNLFTERTRVQMTTSTRTKDSGRTKHSYHLIFLDLAFTTMGGARKFFHAYLSYLAERSFEDEHINALSYVDTAHKRITGASFKFVVDGAVYSKNRLMRMVGQSKAGSNVTLERVLDCLGVKCWPYSGHCVIKPTAWSNLIPNHVTVIETNKLARSSPHPRSKAHEDYTMENVGFAPNILAPLGTSGRQKKVRTDGFLADKDLPNQPITFCRQEEYPVINSNEDVLSFLDGHEMRAVDFPRYFAALTSIVQSKLFTKSRILAWINRSCPDRADRDYGAALKRAPEPRGPLSYAVHLLRSRFPGIYISEWVGGGTEYMSNAWKRAWTILRSEEWRSVSSDDAARIFSECIYGARALIGVRGVMGSGKTYCVLKSIAELRPRCIVYVVGRIKLAGEIAQRCRRMGLNVRMYTDEGFATHMLTGLDTLDESEDEGEYTEDEAAAINQMINHRCGEPTVYVTTTNSMGYIPPGAIMDAIVIDEAETTISNLYSKTLMRINGLMRADYFTRAIRQIPVVISVDANHSDPLYDALYNYMSMAAPAALVGAPAKIRLHLEPQIGHKPIFKEAICCRPIPKERDLRTGRGGDSIIAAVLEYVVIQKKCVAIATASRRTVETLHNLLLAEYVRVNGRALNICTVTSADKIPDNLSVDEHVSKADVFIYNSALSCGHSIEIPDKFAAVFAIFAFDRFGCSMPSLTEQMQMTARVRTCMQQRLYFSLDVIGWAKGRGQTTQSESSRQCFNVALESHFNAISSAERVLRDLPYLCILEYVSNMITTEYPGIRIKPRKPVLLIDMALNDLATRMRIFNQALIEIYGASGSALTKRILFRDSVRVAGPPYKVSHVRPSVINLKGTEEAIDKLRALSHVPFDLVPVGDEQCVLCPRLIGDTTTLRLDAKLDHRPDQ